MAILTGIFSRLYGSVGSVTFSQTGGKTVVKQKVGKKSVPVRTWRQMRRRVLWANLVNLYRAFSGRLHPSFENKEAGCSDYNEFMSVNIGGSGVALTAEEARQGGCVVSSYQVTRGTLPSVGVTFAENNVPVTDIAVGGLALGASTTLKTFSKAILDNNSSWKNGDQLSVFIARQTVDSTTGVPRVKIEAVEITLDKNNETALLGDLVDIDLFTVADGFLSLAGSVNGGVAVVHSRLTPEGTEVSTQFFVVSNPLLVQYQSEAAVEAAVMSYGGVAQEEFLTPNVDAMA